MSSTAMNFVTYPNGGEDPLALLPRTPLREFRKGDIIYRPEQRAEALYLVHAGRVKLSRWRDADTEVVLEYCHKDDFFGETGFLGEATYGEQAVAAEPTAVMQWTIAELKRLMARVPGLGPALLRVTVAKLEQARERIESLCLDPIHRRLAKTLVDLGRRGGQTTEGSTVHLMPTTHEQLARYVGTSREIVTQHLNQFRRDGLLRYSRQGLDLDVAALERYLAGG